jgi:hypothetical protein
MPRLTVLITWYNIYKAGNMFPARFYYTILFMVLPITG